LTVTEQVADLLSTEAVIVAVPPATAVTFPLATVATDSFELDQVTVLDVAFEGLTDAVKVAVLPISSVREAGLTKTSETGMVESPPGFDGGIGSSLGPQPVKLKTARERAQKAPQNP
jgi:hypothetical protein